MKKIILAFTLMVSASSAMSVNLNELTDFSNTMRDRFSVPDHIAKAEQARNAGMKCNALMTDEKTGKQFKSQFSTGPEDKPMVSGNDLTYHEEDNTGSTTLVINKNTGKGFITIMDASHVIATGNVICK